MDEPRFTIEHTHRVVKLEYRLRPANKRKRIVLLDHTGNYYKVDKIMVHVSGQKQATAVFYGYRIMPDTGAHLDPSPTHFVPDEKLIAGIKEEIEGIVRQQIETLL